MRKKAFAKFILHFLHFLHFWENLRLKTPHLFLFHPPLILHSSSTLVEEVEEVEDKNS